MSSSTTATAQPLTGSCLCGKINYTIAAGAQPKANVICYCNNCRKVTGTHMFNSSVFSAAEVTFSPASSPKIYEDHKTSSGNVLERYFCGDCGSPICCVSRSEQGKEVISITAGTVDPGQEERGWGWKPNMVVYGEGRPKWLTGIEVEGEMKVEELGQQQHKKMD